MERKHTPVYFILMAFLLLFTSCQEPAEDLVLAVWVEAVNEAWSPDTQYPNSCEYEGPDAGYQATLVFNSDNTYRWEYSRGGSVPEPFTGYYYGTFSLINDTTLVLNREGGESMSPFRDPISLGAKIDTLTQLIDGDEMTLRGHRGGCIRYWEGQ